MSALEALIKERTRQHGPMSVADYMELALTHPAHGYYMHGDPLGAAGDFITAPEISQIFGELIGAWLASEWLGMGKPHTALAELGPGRGTLMNDILRATQSVPGFHEAISIHLVEASPALRQKQQALLAEKHPRIHWHASFEEIPQKPLLLVANEFFDALPIRQYVWHDEQWLERRVGVDDDGALIFTVIPASTEMMVEKSEMSEQIIQAIAQHIAIHGGAALIIDYGYTGGSRGDTLQAVKQHAYHDVLKDPGTADLTAHVNFAALAEAAQQADAVSYGPLTQRDFLLRLGADIRLAKLCENAAPSQKSAMISGLERLISKEQMGELFKVLCIAHRTQPKPTAF